MDSSTSPTPRLLLATASRDINIANALAALRWPIKSVTDPSEALTILLGPNPPDVAFLDANLPGRNGFEVAAEVRRRLEKRQTWIILVSDLADTATVEAASDAGADDLLLCPPAEPISEIELRIRLGVAARAQSLTRQLEAQVKAQAVAAGFHASHDHLTGLWNRESILSMLFPETDRVQRMGTPLSLLLLDLDHFARVNDEHGYEAGDIVLQELASRMRRYMRSYDLIGRCNADEFLIALPGCNSARALHLAQRIRTILLHRPFSAGSEMITITASIGLAQSRGRSPLVVLREAERALAKAKLEGRNCEWEYFPPQQRPDRILLEEQPA